jgi:hypothetical protein
MTMTERHHSHARDTSADRISSGPGTSTRLDPEPSKEQMVLDRMGGRMGFVYSTIPIVVFVTANLLFPLVVTVAVAVAVGLGLTAFRMVRGERWTSAVLSLVGVAVAATVVVLTGSARNYFVLGIWANFAGFVLTTASVLARWPATGLIWSFLHGGTYAWRSHRSVLRAHTLATLAAAAVLGARFVVQQWLYVADATSGLGLARIAMGTPLSALVAVAVVWAFRHSSKQLISQTASDNRAQTQEVPGDGRR